MNVHFERGQLLYQQGRYGMAEESFRLALGDDPDFALAHGYLSLCLLEKEDWKGATEAAERAVGLAPAASFPLFVLANTLLRRNRPEEAESVAKRAVEIDPYDANLHYILGATYLAQKRWADALAQADEGLRAEPAHNGCANLKASALVNLGRKAEADQVMEGVLARDPEDAYSHANQGWTALHQSDPKKALIHFREALRLDPTLEYAQAGMVEALKARYLVYRLMLRWFLWMARLGQKWQWGIVLLLMFGTRFVKQVADRSPDLGVVLWPIYWALVGFAMFTWLASPLFNLMLRLNRYGKHILTTDQRRGAIGVGVCLASALGVLIYSLIANFPPLQDLALVIAIYSLVVSGLFVTAAGWPRYLALAGALFLAAVPTYGVWLIWTALDLPIAQAKPQIRAGFDTLGVYFPGVLIYTLGVNFLASNRFDRR